MKALATAAAWKLPKLDRTWAAVLCHVVYLRFIFSMTALSLSRTFGKYTRCKNSQPIVQALALGC